MALRRFTASSISSAGGKSSKLWDQTTTMGTYESIATVVAGGSDGFVFSNIPQSYTHLQLRGVVRVNSGAGTGNCYIQVNSDSSSNYATHGVFGNGTAGASYGVSSSAYPIIGYQVPGNTANASTYGAIIVDFLDYTNTTKNKVFRSLSGADQNGSGVVSLNSGVWFKAGTGVTSDAITSFQFIPDGSSFLVGSQFALYGIRGA